MSVSVGDSYYVTSKGYHQSYLKRFQNIKNIIDHLRNNIYFEKEEIEAKKLEEKNLAESQTTIGDILKASMGENVIIFCEHPHVYTLGHSGNEENMLMYPDQLEKIHAEFVRIDRRESYRWRLPMSFLRAIL